MESESAGASESTKLEVVATINSTEVTVDVLLNNTNTTIDYQAFEAAKEHTLKNLPIPLVIKSAR